MYVFEGKPFLNLHDIPLGFPLFLGRTVHGMFQRPSPTSPGEATYVVTAKNDAGEVAQLGKSQLGVVEPRKKPGLTFH